MDSTTVKLDREGRILIPAKIRKTLGIAHGDELLLRLVDDERLEVTAKASQPRIAKRLLQASLEK